jgi:hypothetical protein
MFLTANDGYPLFGLMSSAFGLLRWGMVGHFSSYTRNTRREYHGQSCLEMELAPLRR